jgi:predicted aspartyl protease
MQRIILVGFMVSLAAGACGDAGAPQLADSGVGQDQQPGGDHQPPDGRLADTRPGVCPSGVPFQQTNGKLMMQATFDGKGPFTVFYDTGAPDSIVSTQVTGLAAGASATVKVIGIGDSIKLGPLAVTTYAFPPSYDAIIGNDLFAGKVVSIDYRRSLLWVDDQLDEGSLTACKHAQGSPTVLNIVQGASGHLYVPASVQGLDGYLLVDTGASVGGMSVDALALSKKNNPIVEGFELPMAYGTFWAGYTIIGDITVGGRAATRLFMYSQPDDMIPAAPSGRTLGVLPYGYLRHFLVSVDLATHRLRLDPFVGETMSEGARLFGYGLSLSVNASGPVSISRVIAGSPADRAGLKVGDEVTTISGVDPSSLAPKARINKVLASTAGLRASVTIKRGSTELTAELVAEDLFASF